MALGRRFGKQVCRIAAFGQQLWRTALGTTLWSSAGEQLWGAALGSSFEEQLCTAALKNRSFGEHLWGVAFRPQLWGAIFGSNFGEQLSAAFRSFGATALENSFGHNFVEQRRGTALGSSFREELWGATLHGSSEKFQLWGAPLWTQLWGAAFSSNFGEQLSGVAFGEPLRGAALASCPEQLPGTIALKNSSFRGLSGAALQNSFGEPFGGIGLKSCNFGAIALDSSFW